jgi:hypothetical protein
MCRVVAASGLNARPEGRMTGRRWIQAAAAAAIVMVAGGIALLGRSDLLRALRRDPAADPEPRVALLASRSTRTGS